MVLGVWPENFRKVKTPHELGHLLNEFCVVEVRVCADDFMQRGVIVAGTAEDGLTNKIFFPAQLP